MYVSILRPRRSKKPLNASAGLKPEAHKAENLQSRAKNPTSPGFPCTVRENTEVHRELICILRG